MAKSNKVIIIGAGSVGGHVVSNKNDYLRNFEIVGFLDDDESKHNRDFENYPVKGGVEFIENYNKDINIVVAIAFPKLKKQIIDYLINIGYTNIVSLVSKHAWISNDVEIGKGVIIYPGVMINYRTIIEDFVIINMNCVVGHDCIIGKYTSLAPSTSLGGRNDIGAFCEMGIGSSTIQNIKIANETVIGGQSMVIKNITESCRVAGIPAKKI